MKRFLGWLNGIRKSLWKLLSGGKVISAISHFVLVLAGCLAPAYLVYAAIGTTWAILTFKLMGEFWAIFMTSREVADYFKKKAKALVVRDIDETWQDGLGDLVGPYFVSLVGWLGVLWLIFGGG